MNKLSPKVLTIVALLALIVGLSGCCCIVKSCLHQVLIINQPQSVVALTNTDAAFSVLAWSGPPFSTNGVSYQWQSNSIQLCYTNLNQNWFDIPGETNSTLTIINVDLYNVGFYRVKVSGSATETSDAASLQVMTTSGTGTITVTGTPVARGGNPSGCPGSYNGYVYYTRTNGWGWFPISGVTCTATDGTHPPPQSPVFSKVEANGYNFDHPCAPGGKLTMPTQPSSPQYQFHIYFPNTVPTGNYTLNLDNFQ